MSLRFLQYSPEPTEPIRGVRGTHRPCMALIVADFFAAS